MTKRKAAAAAEREKPKPASRARGKAQAEAPTPARPPRATPRATPRAAPKPTPKPTPKEARPRDRRRPASNLPPVVVEPDPVPEYRPESSVLERKRLEVAEDLRKVETQIYELETKYLDSSSAYGNAVRGYEGFLGGAGVANRKVVIKPEERLFSASSATGHASVR